MAIALSTINALYQTLQDFVAWLRSPLHATIERPAIAPAGTGSRSPHALPQPQGWPLLVRGKVTPSTTALHKPGAGWPFMAQGRPLRVVQARGRVVICGRMADVCAELDRLAALEAQAALH